jgi:uncharacterized protein
MTGAMTPDNTNLKLLNRIADALDRMAPPPVEAASLKAGAAFTWDGARLSPVNRFAPMPIDLLIGIDRQKAAFVDNLTRFAKGAAAHDVLLWGARGTGKSALVKSATAAVRADASALALVAVGAIEALPTLFAMLDGVDRRFLLFFDDLGFDAPGEARVMRSVLEGGVEARPDNVRLAVTSNRRHLVPRDIAEQESAINPRDSIDDALALADRFGLSLGFHALDQDGYLAIVDAYAAHHGVTVSHHDALEWSRRRGSRSGRVASQYVVEAAGRADQSIGSD